MTDTDESGIVELDRRRFVQATGVGVAGLAAGGVPIAQGQYEASWDNPDDVLDVLYLGGVEDGATHYSEDLYKILGPYMLHRGVKLHYTERQDDLNEETLSHYDAVMLYGNRLDPTEEQIDALENFVEDGGGFVPVHSASASFGAFGGAEGDDLAERFISLVGGAFSHHGSGEMTTDRVESDHPVFEGTEAIESPWEETYQHTAIQDDIEVLAYGAGHSDYDDIDEPFTWVRTQGDGRVFYTAWGHDERTWELEGFKQLLHNAFRWASGNEDTIGDHPTLDELPYVPATDFGQQAVPYYQGDAPDVVSSDDDGIWDLVQSPLSPEDSITHTVTPAEFEMEPFVTEEDFPEDVDGQIMDMTFDAAGRCWIAVSKEYPYVEEGGRDTIVICEDTDGDGRADDFTVFKDGLTIPFSIIPYKDGVLVSECEDENGDSRVAYFGDEDGDDVADEEETLFTFGTFDTHAGLNQLHYGVDNWVYGVVGYDGISTEYGGESYNFSQDVFRFKPDGSEMEYVGAGSSNMAGVKTNEEGLLFCSSATAGSNVSTYAAIPASYYDYINGYSGPTTVDIRGQELSRTEYENRILPFNDRFRQVDQINGFTAATDQEFYTAREFPQQYWNSTTFVGEGTGQLMATFYLEQDGASYVSHNYHNLAASNDEWFSPTYVNTGPDGQVWMIDLYNYIFQHNPTPGGSADPYDEYDSAPRAAYETDVRDDEHGRLYRVTYGDDIDLQPRDLSDASPEELVDALTDDNKFWRMTAQRKLIDRGELDVVDDLVDLVADQSVDEIGLNPGAIHALWTLEGLDAFDETATSGGFTHADPDDLDHVDDEDVDHVIFWNEDEDVTVAEVAQEALSHESAGVRLNAARVLPATEETRDAIVDSGALEDDDWRVVQWAMLKLAETPASDEAGAAVFEAIDDEDRLQDDFLVAAASVAGATHAEGFMDAYEAEYGDPDDGDDGDGEPVNVLENGDIEDVEGVGPDEWETDVAAGQADFEYTDDESDSGERSVRIELTEAGEARWAQTVSVEPNTDYVLSGRVKTEDVEEEPSFGAFLTAIPIYADADTNFVHGTSEWTDVQSEFNSGDNEELDIWANLGASHNDDVPTTGTAWYDDLSLVEADGDENLLANADFEEGGLEPTGAVGWENTTYGGDAEFSVTNEASHGGDYSLSTSSDSGTDAGWNTTVEVEPNTDYTLVGHIKTEDVETEDSVPDWAPEGAPYGACLSIEQLANDAGLGDDAITDDVTGTEDWTEVTLEFNSQDYDELQINALFGAYASNATGTAYFDSIEVIDPNGAVELPNILENGDFEEVDDDGMPVGWESNTWGGSGDFSVDDSEAYSGNNSARIDSDNGADASWTQGIDVEPNVTYEATFRIKAEDLEPGGSLGAGSNLHELQQEYLPEFLGEGDTDWVERSYTFNSGGNSSLTFNLLMGGWGTATGTVWWDQVEVRPTQAVGDGIDAIYGRVQSHYESEGGDGGDGGDDDALDPAETIELGGELGGWAGQAPDSIEEETNPTLRLLEGEEYTIEWTNLDGNPHSFEITDSPNWGQGDVLESTGDLMSDEGETETLTFEATAEMAGYDCPPHGEMSGEIEIVEE